MSDQEIQELFDSQPNLLMSQLCSMTGKSMSELKQILMGV